MVCLTWDRTMLAWQYEYTFGSNPVAMYDFKHLRACADKMQQSFHPRPPGVTYWMATDNNAMFAGTGVPDERVPCELVMHFDTFTDLYYAVLRYGAMIESRPE